MGNLIIMLPNLETDYFATLYVRLRHNFPVGPYFLILTSKRLDRLDSVLDKSIKLFYCFHFEKIMICGLPGVEPGQRLRQAVGTLRRRGGPANPSVSLAACGCATELPAASAPSRNPPHGSCPRSSGAAAPSAGRCRADRIRPPPAAASAARGPGRRRR